jgi:hypothetical protein
VAAVQHFPNPFIAPLHPSMIFMFIYYTLNSISDTSNYHNGIQKFLLKEQAKKFSAIMEPGWSYCRIHKRPSVDPILSQLNPVNAFKT